MMEKIKRFLEPIKFHPKYVIANALESINQGSWGYLTPWFFATITGYLEVSSKTQIFSPEALRLIWIYSGLTLFQYSLSILTRNTSRVWSNLTMHKLFDIHLRKFFQLNNNKSELLGTGKLTSIVNEGVSSRTNILNFLSSTVLRQIISIVGSFVFIYQINHRYFFISLIVAILLVPVLFWFTKKTEYLRLERKDINTERSRSNTRFFMSKFEILANNKVEQESESYKQLRYKDIILTRKQGTWQFFTYDTPYFLADVMRIVIMVGAAYTIYMSTSTLAEFIGLSSAIGYVTNSLSSITNNFRQYPDMFVSVRKLREIFDETPQMIGYDTGKVFKHKEGEIEISDMTYSYGDKKVFENFSLTLKGGTTTALIGPSGGGKSTLIKLIAGYLQCQQGSIKIDNQSLPSEGQSDTSKSVSLRSYYKEIGYLSQEPSIFDGSIKDNLIYGVLDGKTKKSTEENMKNVIGSAKCERIYDMKDGLDTQIGEKGVRLSGGQKQRLAIAKIMLKDPSIILLDEPTSALDSFSEDEVTKAMNNLFKGRTVIIIAHRLQTVKHADEIIVLDNDKKDQHTKIIERGSHKELLAKGGFYAKMLELQSGF